MAIQRYYHLSTVYIGMTPVLTPRIPRDPMIFEDRKIKRVCVAIEISGCLLALKNTFYNQGIWYIYETDAVAVFEPINVPDASQTGEMWLLEKVIFNYAGCLQTDVSGTIKNKRFPKTSVRS